MALEKTLTVRKRQGVMLTQHPSLTHVM